MIWIILLNLKKNQTKQIKHRRDKIKMKELSKLIIEAEIIYIKIKLC